RHNPVSIFGSLVKKTVLISFAALAVAIPPAIAQHHGHGQRHQAGGGQHNSYAGLQERSIKALSDEQIAGLKAGRGLGMAMPAELNGYPGPLHVLELASQLDLTPEHTEQTKTLFTEMQSHAKAAGEKVIAAEQALDLLFKDKKATAQNLSAAVEQ